MLCVLLLSRVQGGWENVQMYVENVNVSWSILWRNMFTLYTFAFHTFVRCCITGVKFAWTLPHWDSILSGHHMHDLHSLAIWSVKGCTHITLDVLLVIYFVELFIICNMNHRKHKITLLHAHSLGQGHFDCPCCISVMCSSGSASSENRINLWPPPRRLCFWYNIRHLEGTDIFECVQCGSDPNLDHSEFKCGLMRGLLGLGGCLYSTDCNSCLII